MVICRVYSIGLCYFKDCSAALAFQPSVRPRIQRDGGEVEAERVG